MIAPSEPSTDDTDPTPGPWHVEDSWIPLSEAAANAIRHIAVVADDLSNPMICSVASDAVDDKAQARDIANARMIAAAPTMHDVCSGFCVTESKGIVTLQVGDTTIIRTSSAGQNGRALLKLDRSRRAACAIVDGR